MEAPPTPPPPAGRWTRRRAKCRFYNDSSHKYVQLSLTRREGRGRDAVGGCFETGRDDGKMIYGMIYGTFSAFPFLIRENIPLSLCNVPQKSTTTSYPHTQTRARARTNDVRARVPLPQAPPIFLLSPVCLVCQRYSAPQSPISVIIFRPFERWRTASISARSVSERRNLNTFRLSSGCSETPRRVPFLK